MEKVLTLLVVGVLGGLCFWESPELRPIIIGGGLVGAGDAIASSKGSPAEPRAPRRAGILPASKSKDREGFTRLKKIKSARTGEDA